jgi:8-oxo-dGTP pyrophosphatase MutT (NUDIX family)
MSELIDGLPPPPPPVDPLVASAVILWREGPRGREVYWVRRGTLRFAGGFQAFPGGRLEDEDALVGVVVLVATLALRLIDAKIIF